MYQQRFNPVHSIWGLGGGGIWIFKIHFRLIRYDDLRIHDYKDFEMFDTGAGGLVPLVPALYNRLKNSCEKQL